MTIELQTVPGWGINLYGDMRKLLAILVILALIMYFTKPTAEKHKAAIADEIVKAAQVGGLDSTAIVCWDFEGKNAEFVAQAKIAPRRPARQRWRKWARR